jgi:hypothetical protein
MEWQTLYEIKLGKLPDQVSEKKARVILGNGSSTNSDGSLRKFTIIRVDIRIHNGDTIGNGVSLSNSEFTWFINLVKLNLETASSYHGKRTLILNRTIDRNCVVSTVENERVYGLSFTQDELKIMLKNHEIISFILKHYNINWYTIKKTSHKFIHRSRV